MGNPQPPYATQRQNPLCGSEDEQKGSRRADIQADSRGADANRHKPNKEWKSVHNSKPESKLGAGEGEVVRIIQNILGQIVVHHKFKAFKSLEQMK